MGGPEDNLGYENNPEVMSKIGGEKIFYSDKIHKKNQGIFA